MIDIFFIPRCVRLITVVSELTPSSLAARSSSYEDDVVSEDFLGLHE